MNGWSKDSFPEEIARWREEAFERGRRAGDGIPRTPAGQKWDWDLERTGIVADALSLEREALEKHIEALMALQIKEDNE